MCQKVLGKSLKPDFLYYNVNFEFTVDGPLQYRRREATKTVHKRKMVHIYEFINALDVFEAVVLGCPVS